MGLCGLVARRSLVLRGSLVGNLLNDKMNMVLMVVVICLCSLLLLGGCTGVFL